MAATIALAARNQDNFSFPRWEYENDFYVPRVFHSNLPAFQTYQEPHFHYTPIPYNKCLNLHGYFQSEKYFDDQSHIIKRMLMPRHAHDVSTYYCSEYTAIHVRRKDYLVHHGCYNILDMGNYYEKAMEVCPSAKYLIFSDDLAWCKQHFVGNQFDFSEERYAAKDLGNMINCSNVIMANSSFSWWGAWLNSNPNKIVVAPAKWFGPKLAPTHNTKDLIPSGWLKV
jgi:hypothetical protein